MKRIIQDQKYNCKNNIKLMYLTFIHCTCKFGKHKQSFLSSENYEPTFLNKNHKKSHIGGRRGVIIPTHLG